MSCRKNLIIGFGIFLPVFVSVLLSSSCYATDVTYNIDNSSTFPFSLCYDSNSASSPRCSDYNYMIIENTSFVYGTSYYFTVQTGWGAFRPFYASKTILDLSSEAFQYEVRISNFYAGANTYTITLTDDLPSSGCPEPEEPECPAIPENPYDDKLDNITMAIYCCGGILLVLYFFYCIYRIIIKSSGVDRL